MSILGIGKGLPWTNQQADAMKNSFSPEGKQGMLIIFYAKHIIMTHRMYYIIVSMCTSIVSAHCCHHISSLGYAVFGMNAYTYNVYYLSCTYSSIPSPISPPDLTCLTGARGVAGKKLSPEELERLKSKLVKPITKQTAAQQKASQPVDATPAKKGFFGLF